MFCFRRGIRVRRKSGSSFQFLLTIRDSRFGGDEVILCLFIVEIIDQVNTSSSGRYQPPTVEAPSAGELGSVVIGIICIFMLALLFLDLATLRRDLAWFVNNIRLQKRLWLAKRRLRQKRNEAKALKAA